MFAAIHSSFYTKSIQMEMLKAFSCSVSLSYSVSRLFAKSLIKFTLNAARDYSTVYRTRLLPSSFQFSFQQAAKHMPMKNIFNVEYCQYAFYVEKEQLVRASHQQKSCQ